MYVVVPVPSTVRVPVYIHKRILEAVRNAYPDAKSNGEAIALFIYETLGGLIERREFPTDVTELAHALAVIKRVGEK